METRANYVAIGLFVLAVATAALGALWWLYRSSEPGVTEVVRIIFPEPVTGLSAGGSVLFNGIRVGEVSELNFAPNGGDDVIALTRINQRAPIKTDTVAVLGFTGLTGVAHISLTGGSRDAPSLFTSAPEGEIPTMRARTSAFTNVLDSAQTVLGQLNTTLTQINGFIGDNRSRFDSVVQNVDELTGSLNEAAPQVPELIDNLTTASQQIAQAVPQVTETFESANEILSAVEPDQVGSIIGNVDTFTQSLPQIAEDARTIVGNVNGLVTRLDDTAGVLGEAVTAVRDVVTSIDQDAVGAIVANVRDATNVIAERAADISLTLENAAAISTDVRVVTATIAERREQIETVISDSATVTANLRDASERVPGFMDTLQNSADGIANVVSAIDPEAISGIVEDVRTVTSAIANEAPGVGGLIANVTAAAQNIETLSSGLTERLPAVDGILADVGSAAASAASALEQADTLVADVAPQVRQLGEAIAVVTPARVDDVLTNTQLVVAGLSQQAPNFTAIMTDVRAGAEAARTIATTLAERAPQLAALVDDASAAASSVREAADGLPALVDAAEPGVRSASAALEALDAEAISAIQSDVAAFAETLAAQSENINTLLSSASSTAQRVETFVAAIQQRTPQIEAILDGVESTVASANRFADTLPGFADTLRPGIENVSEVLSAIDPDAVEGLVNDASRLAATLANEEENIRGILADARAAADAARTTLSAVSARTPQIESAIDNASAAIADARAFAARLPEVGDQISATATRIADVAAAIDAEAVNAVVDDVSAFTAVLRAESETVARIIAQVDGITARADRLVAAVAERTPQITAAIENAASAVESAERFAESLPGLADTLEPGIENIATVLSSIDAEAVSGAVEDLRLLTETLAAQAPRISTIVRNAEVVSTDAAAIAARLRGELDTVSAAIGDARVAIADARTFAAGLPELLETVQPGLENVSAALQAIDPDAITQILQNVEALSVTLRESRDDIQSVIATANTVSRQVEAVTSAISARVDAIGSTIENVSTFAQSLGAAAPNVDVIVTEARNALEAIGQTVRAINAEAINEVVANIRSAAQAIGSRSAEIGAAIDNAADAARGLSEGLGTIGGEDGVLRDVLDRAQRIAINLEGASQQVSGLVNRASTLFDGPVQGLVASVTNAADEVGDVAAAFASRADQIAGGLSRFSTGGLDDLRAVLTQGRSTLSAIETAVSRFDRNPSRVIFGGPDGPRYTPQRR